MTDLFGRSMPPPSREMLYQMSMQGDWAREDKRRRAPQILARYDAAIEAKRAELRALRSRRRRFLKEFGDGDAKQSSTTTPSDATSEQ